MANRDVDALQHVLAGYCGGGQAQPRAMSFYTMAFMGMVSFGSLMGGGLALPLLRRITRPLYIDLGIIRDDLAGSTLVEQWVPRGGQRVAHTQR